MCTVHVGVYLFIYFLSLSLSSISQVFVVELFAALVANLYANNNCYPYFPITNTLEIFKRKVYCKFTAQP